LLALAVGGLILLRRVVVAPICRLRSDALAVAPGELEQPRPSVQGQGNKGGTYDPGLPSGEAALTVARVRLPASGYVTLTAGHLAPESERRTHASAGGGTRCESGAVPPL
jgi:hypothetical protein